MRLWISLIITNILWAANFFYLRHRYRKLLSKVFSDLNYIFKMWKSRRISDADFRRAGVTLSYVAMDCKFLDTHEH